MDYLPIPEAATRQLIDSTTVFEEHARVKAQARPYAGGMYWKRQGAYEYLVKTNGVVQKSVGARSPRTEAIFEEFMSHKRDLEARLKSLAQQLDQACRLNKAVKVGRVPSVVVNVLQALDDAGLSEHFAVVGTHALYAYETAAGVRIVPEALATKDVDLLRDARKRVRFLTDLKLKGPSMLAVLQRTDRTFRRKQGQLETAINDKGFEVDFLRRISEAGDPHPFRFSADEEDLWPAQANRASVLTSAARWRHVVVSVTGRMAVMSTVPPRTFVEFKRWMSERADRDPLKRQRDARQAAIVARLLDEGLLLQ